MSLFGAALHGNRYFALKPCKASQNGGLPVGRMTATSMSRQALTIGDVMVKAGVSCTSSVLSASQANWFMYRAAKLGSCMDCQHADMSLL